MEGEFLKGDRPMRFKMSYVIGGLIAIVILLLPKIILPQLIEEKLVAVIETDLGGSATVEISSKTGWSLLAGSISEISVIGNDWNINGIPLASFSFHTTNLKIDVRQLMQDGALNYLKSDEINVVAEITEAGLNHYFWNYVDSNQNFKIDITKSGANLRGEFDLWNTIWDLNLLMEIQIREQRKIALIPRELILLETRVPNILIELISEHYTIVIDLNALPVPIKVDEVNLTNRKMVLYGSGASE